jgi:hypothetical protein
VTDEKSPQPKDQERPEKIIDDMVGALDAIHADLTDAATKVGESKETIQGLREPWKAMGDATTRSPEVAAIYQSGVQALAAQRDRIFGLTREVSPLAQRVDLINLSSDGTASITAVTHSFVKSGVLLVSPPQPTLPPREETSKIEGLLASLDPPLAASYVAIREALYGTRADPERTALYESRQVFDHLFSILSPDDKVRASPYWKQKTEPDPNKVTRDERLRYGAMTHARTPVEARSLIASSRHMLNVHDALSRAHTRATLDPNQAKASLTEMDSLIRQWIAAIDVPAIVTARNASA